MGLLTSLKNLFTPEEPAKLEWDEPQQALNGQDVSFNPPPDASYERQLGRLLNLYNVQVKSDEVLAEIDRYRTSIDALGYHAPLDAEETQTYIDLLKG